VHFGTELTSVPLTWALYLPESWATDPARRAEVGIPPSVAFQTKPALALACLDQIALGLAPRPLLAIPSSAIAGTSARASQPGLSLLRAGGAEHGRVAELPHPAPSPPRGPAPHPAAPGGAARAPGPGRPRPGAPRARLAHRDLAARQQGPAHVPLCPLPGLVCPSLPASGPYAPGRRPASGSGARRSRPHQYWLADLRGSRWGPPARRRPRAAGASRRTTGSSRTNSGRSTSRAPWSGASPCDPGQYGMRSWCWNGPRQKKTSCRPCAQIRRLQQLLLRLGEWCPCAGLAIAL